MRRVRSRRGHSSRYRATPELINDLLAPDPADAELAAAWFALRDQLRHPDSLRDEPLWAFWPGVPANLRVRPPDLDPRLLMLGPAEEAAYHHQADLAESQLAARRTWLRTHPDMVAG